MRPGRFSAAMALGWLNAHMPHCPPQIRERLADRIAGRRWRTGSLQGAAEIAAAALARHELTDYDRLYRIEGLTREEARAIVAAEVEAILDGWRSGL